MKKIKKEKNKLFWNTTFVVFLCLVANLIFFWGFSALNNRFHIFNSTRLPSFIALTIMLGISMVVGALISLFVAKKLTTPINNIKKATKKVARGDFDVKIEKIKNSSLNDLIDDFNTMTSELKSVETLKSDFVSSVSHEFKTPISVIQSYSKILRRNDLDEKTRKKYETVLDTNIQKLINLTEGILNLSKIENQPIILDRTEFSLDEQIRQSVLVLEPEWDKKKIEFELDLDATKIYGPKDLLAQVWTNLISNAVKFSKNKSKIYISLKKENNKSVVKIKDTGIGMNEETQKHIFDKFYQGETANTQTGNGLGLTITNKIIELYKGEIFVESKEGKGSTFTVII